MRISVVGAGAIGGLVGVDLALAGEDVTLIDIGPQLEAIRRDGLTVLSADGERHIDHIRATDSCQEAGEQDLVILALKAHVIRDVAEEMRALYGGDTVVLTMQNGLPWWYFQRHGGELEGWRLESLDPDGRLAANIEAERILGCVSYPASAIERPGVIRHLYGDRFPVGELDGIETERAREISGVFERAGYKSYILDDIRAEIWLKAVGVLAFNGISALTHATMAEICRYPPSRDLAMRVMREAEAVAERLGVTMRVPLERRLAGAERVGEHKTSTLQDVEAGRPLEVEALIGSVVEVGTRLDVPTPAIEAIYASVKLLDETLRRRGVGVRAGETRAADELLSLMTAATES
jgi:2-dehydropantoate 2-reductase